MPLLRIVPAAILLGVGIIFTGQGAGLIHGSSMTGSSFWLVVGILMIVAALVLLRRRRA